MGIYDRDYERGRQYEREPGFHLGGPVTLTTKLVIVTFGVYLVQFFTNQWITEFGSLQADWWRRPWLAYQLLTYGFLHDPSDLKHIGFNMLGLWMFGRQIEERYGRREYLTFYMTALVIAGLAWTVAEIPGGRNVAMLGASGAVTAVVILFALNYPHVTAMFMFLFPMPMWVAGALIVACDIAGAIGRFGTTAFTAHLGGAAFGFLYFRYGLRLERWLPSEATLSRLRPKPKLRVHDPEADGGSETDLAVDEILRKIADHGYETLTRRERRILQKASQKYQKKRQ
jgi:membrane associated rhomboid family serine protease